MYFIGLHIDVLFIIIFTLYFFAFIIQILYYLLIYSKLIYYKYSINEIPKLPVSVIICARDEAANLKKFLPSILTQDYPDFEVIVVNDCSIDNTEIVLNGFCQIYPNLRYTTIKKDNKFTHGKKLAQTVGIKSAKNEILIFTDADCYSVNNKWIEKIQQNFIPETEVVLGYGGYIKNKTLLNKLIRYDTIFIAMQYFSFALSGFPYMGVGRNLAYRKSVFFKNKGFASHFNLDSGDDDLFVNEVSDKNNTRIEISIESHTKSLPKTTFKQWIWQKIRHNTTFRYYKPLHKKLLAGEILSRIFFYCSFIFLLIFYFPLWLFISIIFILSIIVKIIVIKKILKRLNENDLLLFSLFFDFLLPLLNMGFVLANIFIPKHNKWK